MYKKPKVNSNFLILNGHHAGNWLRYDGRLIHREPIITPLPETDYTTMAVNEVTDIDPFELYELKDYNYKFRENEPVFSAYFWVKQGSVKNFQELKDLMLIALLKRNADIYFQ